MIIDMFIGGMAGIISRTLTAPLDLIKMQQQNKYLTESNISNVIRKEGPRHMWKGNLVNCSRVFPQYAINFAIYEQAKKQISFITNKNLKQFVCGGIGGVIATTIVYPLETVRTRMSLQMHNSHYKTPFQVIKRLSFSEIYGGLGTSVLGFGSFSAFNFMFYNKYYDILTEHDINTSSANFLAGGFAGISSLSFTYPTDLLRRRFQMQSFNKDTPNYKSLYDAVTTIVKAEGVRGLYSGLLIAYIRIFPCLAIQFYCINRGKDILI
jgi:solute carrier family 25 (mitochondrial phosphate transporter), member 23/24/25/41